ncbi:hypothetical protein GCM10025734_01520 [Kitasatospora paranensis]|uniref:hypothetical protein n=1 Tax=Kitasatospora paranensis TaxID=258053 RepID=UPI0031EFE4AC
MPDDPVEKFDQFAEQIKAAREAVEAMKAAGASDEEIAEKLKDIKAASLTYLTALPPWELQQIAAAKGFEHPVLVGLSGKGQHPLVHWLDPAYDQDIKSKAAIQAAAHKRYQQLLAGETYGGLTLGDVHQLEGTPMPPTSGGWPATPEQVQQAQTALATAIDELPDKPQLVNGEQLAALLKAERHLAGAECPEMGDALQAAKAKAHQDVDAYLDKAWVKAHNTELAAKEAIDAGLITEQQAGLVSGHQLVKLIRPNTDAATLTMVKEGIAKRQAQLDALDAAMSGYLPVGKDTNGALTLAPLGKGTAEQQSEAVKTAAEWAASTGKLYEAQQAVTSWASQMVLPPTDLTQQHPGLDKENFVLPYKETEALNAWAKQQKLAHLREVAEQLGMTAASKASRAHVQKFIAGHFHPNWKQQPAYVNLAAEQAEKKKAAKARQAAVAPPTPTAPATSAAPAAAATGAGATLTGAPVTPVAKPASPKPTAPAASGGAFAAKNKALVAALQMAGANASDLPKRVESAQVAAMSFGPAQSAALGGAHSKTLHQGPDGGCGCSSRTSRPAAPGRPRRQRPPTLWTWVASPRCRSTRRRSAASRAASSRWSRAPRRSAGVRRPGRRARWTRSCATTSAPGWSETTTATPRTCSRRRRAAWSTSTAVRPSSSSGRTSSISVTPRTVGTALCRSSSSCTRRSWAAAWPRG